MAALQFGCGSERRLPNSFARFSALREVIGFIQFGQLPRAQLAGLEVIMLTTASLWEGPEGAGVRSLERFGQAHFGALGCWNLYLPIGGK